MIGVDWNRKTEAKQPKVLSQQEKRQKTLISKWNMKVKKRHRVYSVDKLESESSEDDAFVR